jgi:hypothetical protein
LCRDRVYRSIANNADSEPSLQERCDLNITVVEKLSRRPDQSNIEHMNAFDPCIEAGGQKVRQSANVIRFSTGNGADSGDARWVMNCEFTWLATVLRERLSKRSSVANVFLAEEA